MEQKKTRREREITNARDYNRSHAARRQPFTDIRVAREFLRNCHFRARNGIKITRFLLPLLPFPPPRSLPTILTGARRPRDLSSPRCAVVSPTNLALEVEVHSGRRRAATPRQAISHDAPLSCSPLRKRASQNSLAARGVSFSPRRHSAHVPLRLA